MSASMAHSSLTPQCLSLLHNTITALPLPNGNSNGNPNGNPNDNSHPCTLSLIFYNESPTTVFPPTVLDKHTKRKALDTLKGFEPKGKADTHEALRCAFDLLPGTNQSSPQSSTILLITDGPPNLGLTDPSLILASLSTYLHSCLATHGPAALPTIYTIGLGPNHPAPLLHALSHTLTHGQYYPLPTLTVPATRLVFKSLIHSLLAPPITDITLTTDPPITSYHTKTTQSNIPPLLHNDVATLLVDITPSPNLNNTNLTITVAYTLAGVQNTTATTYSLTSPTLLPQTPLITAAIALQHATTLAYSTPTPAGALIHRARTSLHAAMASTTPTHWDLAMLQHADRLMQVYAAVGHNGGAVIHGDLYNVHCPTTGGEGGDEAGGGSSAKKSATGATTKVRHTVGAYELTKELGRGAYGIIYSGTAVSPAGPTPPAVAVKRLSKIFDDPHVALQTLREIKLLRHLAGHCNVVAVKEILTDCDRLAEFRCVYLVMELMDSDLQRVINSTVQLSDRHCKKFMYQLLLGLHRLHCAGILHRDLKPSNLLVNGKCELRIADLGLARAVGGVEVDAAKSAEGEAEAPPPPTHLTEYVVTRWYRAPELLLNTGYGYGSAVDVWSAGCIFAELLNRKPLFPGSNYVGQLKAILSGVSAGVQDVAESMLGRDAQTFFDQVKEGLLGGDGGSRAMEETIYGCDKGDNKTDISPESMELLVGLLKFVPSQRFSAATGVRAAYFKGTRKKGAVEKAGDVEVYGEWQSDQRVGTDVEDTKRELWRLCGRDTNT